MGIVTWVIKNIASQILTDEDLTSGHEVRVGGYLERSLDLTSAILVYEMYTKRLSMCMNTVDVTGE